MSVAEKIEQNMVEAVAQQMSGHTPTEEGAGETSELKINNTEGKFDFGEDFQSRVAALMIRDGRFVRRCADIVEPGYFENAGQAMLVAMSKEYFGRYGSVPGDQRLWIDYLRDQFSAKRVRDDLKAEVKNAFRDLWKAPINGVDYVADKVSTFARHQAINQAISEVIDLNEKGDFDSVQKRMEKAFKVGANDDFVSTDFWEDYETRTQRRKDAASGLIKPQGVPTGIKELDSLLFHKGFGRKELTAIMGGAKKGKSTALGHFAVSASKSGYNCLYVTLEVSAEIISDRADANASRTSMSDLESNMMNVRSKVESLSKVAGKLKIVEFPSGTLTPNGLRNMIETFKSEGILFDAIFVDYADIMAPNVYTQDPIENSKQIWLGLRAIGSEENAAMVTATQTNREGFKAQTAKAEHASDDFNKIRIADLVITINKTEEEAKRNEARLYFAASRNQAGETVVTIRQKVEEMVFIDKVVNIA